MPFFQFIEQPTPDVQLEDQGQQLYLQTLSFICWKLLLPACSAPLTLCPTPSISLDFVYDLFERVQSRNKQDTLKISSKHRRPTVSSQFKVGILQVAPLATLDSAH